MLSIKPLKEQIPQSDQGSKEPLVEAFALQSRELAQGAVGQQLEEETKELSRGEGGWRRRFGLQGVFLDDNLVCILYIMHT
jgi:hypothetical protein